jgi:hypothetical protein
MKIFVTLGSISHVRLRQARSVKSVGLVKNFAFLRSTGMPGHARVTLYQFWTRTSSEAVVT